jgi:hypothetical protein
VSRSVKRGDAFAAIMKRRRDLGIALLAVADLPVSGYAHRRMPRTSASRKAQRSATIYDFVPFLVRHLLSWRIGPRGVLLARTTNANVITVVHRIRDACTGETVDRRIAQLRPESESYQLFWKKGNGRWTAYYDDRGDVFLGSLSECLSEISRDPYSCYWS